MPCPSCGAANPPGHRFCGRCGSPLVAACPTCGAVPEPGERFCGRCGTPLLQAASAPVAPPPGRAPQTERRVVSILFADLVGFTPLAERRDAEEVRELLSTYFDTARTVVARYGGVVEKFIGDAVMALWGAPTAREDDAERAVRAGLDLCDAVAVFGESAGAPDLRLRAGVVTGEAAITLGAEGQGMVAGDTVNTASRIQATAPAGTLLVDEATRRTTEPAIAYDDAGSHLLKGKAEPMRLFRARRVTGRRGAAGTAALEAPFVGRDHELRLVKDLFEASAGDRRSRLVAVSGPAGIGKSRLSWEFEKYLDGISATVLWHRGRCLAYGDGVAYWALAEMVRRRSGITDAEDTGVAREKLRATVTRFAVDADEVRWVEPRLAHLLDLDVAPPGDRADLFAAWRLFVERMSETAPVVLVFEDMQWADSGLVDFVTYLMEWSRHHPLFVITLARPDFNERHPGFATGLRSVHSLYLEPLTPAAMDDLLRGLAPGLSQEARARIAERAEGVPLYAVETVRMLLDRGTLVREGDSIVVAGALDDVEVPETLHALIAARLDNLGDDEKAVVRDASVLGQSFPVDRLVALGGTPEARIRPILDSLVRREILAVDVDPRSPGRGQYAFSQALVQRVAYDTLSRHDRKLRHLAAARHLEERSGGGDDVVEVVAAHYLEAYAAAPQDADAEDLRRLARDTLVRAGERALSLAATDNAQRYFMRASGLTGDPEERAFMLARAGGACAAAGRLDEARGLLEQASAGAGAPELRAEIAARLGDVDWAQGRTADAVQRLEGACEVLCAQGHLARGATVGAQLARFAWLGGDTDRGLEVADDTLEIAEREGARAVLSSLLNTKGMILTQRGRFEEGLALLEHALRIAQHDGLTAEEERASNNLGVLATASGDVAGANTHSARALEIARRRGDRGAMCFMAGNLAGGNLTLGNWDEALRLVDEMSHEAGETASVGSLLLAEVHTEVLLQRGDLAGASQAATLLREVTASDPQAVVGQSVTLARIAMAQGDVDAAASLADLAMQQGDLAWGVRAGLAVLLVVESALQRGDSARADAVVAGARAKAERMHDRMIIPLLDCASATSAAARGDAAAADAAFRAAAEGLRSMQLRPMLADVLLRHAEWLASEGRVDETGELVAEVEPIADHLQSPALARRAEAVRAPQAAAPGRVPVVTSARPA